MLMRDDDSGGSPIVLNETVNETDEGTEDDENQNFQQSMDFSAMLYSGPVDENQFDKSLTKG